jgi:hypothetical protein
MVFWQYSPYCAKGEWWVTEEAFKALRISARSRQPKDNRPAESERVLRCGDTRNDGMVFVGYRAGFKDGEWWLPRDEFEIMQAAERKRKSSVDNRPPKQARTLRYGDVREDGMVFCGYVACGENGEKWVTRDTFEARRQKANERALAMHHRRKNDPYYRAIRVVRDSANRAVKHVAAATAGRILKPRSFELLGTDVESFKTHIESQFADGMSWENHGEWHIDHIVPLASGKTPEDIWKLCHYTNLQPLWAADNIRKGAKH